MSDNQYIIVHNLTLSKIFTRIYKKNRKFFKNVKFICIGSEIEENFRNFGIKYLDCRDVLNSYEIYTIEKRSKKISKNLFNQFKEKSLLQILEHHFFQDIFRSEFLIKSLKSKLKDNDEEIRILDDYKFLESITDESIKNYLLIKLLKFLYGLESFVIKFKLQTKHLSEILLNYDLKLRKKNKTKILTNTTWRVSQPLELLDKKKYYIYLYLQPSRHDRNNFYSIGFLHLYIYPIILNFLIQVTKGKILKLFNNNFYLEYIDKITDIQIYLKNKIINHYVTKQSTKHILEKFERLLYRSISIYICTEHFLSINTFDFIYLQNDKYLHDRCLIRHASQKNIPTLVVQHGALFLDFWYADIFEERFFAVWSEIQKNHLIKLGANSDKIITTGPPRVFRKKISKYNKKEKINILFPINPPLDETSNITSKKLLDEVKLVIKEFKNKSKNNIVIKLHPHQNEMKFKKMLNETKNNVDIIKHGKIQELILDSDIVISKQSTVVLEAILLGKPVLLLNFFEDHHTIPDLNKHLIEIKNPKDLVFACKRLIDSNHEYFKLIKKQNKFIQSYMPYYEDAGVKKIKKFIEENIK